MKLPSIDWVQIAKKFKKNGVGPSKKPFAQNCEEMQRNSCILLKYPLADHEVTNFNFIND